MKVFFTLTFVLFFTFFLLSQRQPDIHWHEKFIFPKIGGTFQALGKEDSKLIALFNNNIFESFDDGRNWQLRYENDRKFNLHGKPYTSNGEIYYVLKNLIVWQDGIRDIEVRIMSSKSSMPKVVDEYFNSQYNTTDYTFPFKCANERIYISRWTIARSSLAVNKQGFMNIRLEDRPFGQELWGNYVGYNSGSHVFIDDSIRVFNSYWQYQQLDAIPFPNSPASGEFFYKVIDGKLYKIDKQGGFTIIDLKTTDFSTGNLDLNIDSIEIHNDQLFFQNSEGLFKASDSELLGVDTIFYSEQHDLNLLNYYYESGEIYYGTFDCGKIGKTIDNGKTWEFWYPEGVVLHPFDVEVGFKDSVFLQSNCLGNFYLNCENELIETNERASKSIYQTGDTVLIIKGTQLLFSEDKGSSWQPLFKNNQNLVGGTVVNNSIIVHDTLMYLTHDFGNSWDTIDFSVISKVDKYSDNLIVESNTGLYKSSDFSNFEEILAPNGGQSWGVFPNALQSWGANSKTLWRFSDYEFYYKISLNEDWIKHPYTFGYRENTSLQSASQDSIIFTDVSFSWYAFPEVFHSRAQSISMDGGVTWKFVNPRNIEELRPQISGNFLYAFPNGKLYQARISDLLLDTLPIENTVYFCDSSVQIGNQNFSEPQTMMVDLGCDSLVFTRIEQAEVYFNSIDTLVNVGDLIEGFSILNDTTFEVVHQSAQTCDSVVFYLVTVNQTSSTQDLSFEDNIQIYPNPVSGEAALNIVFEEGIRDENAEMKIINPFGKVMTKNNLPVGQNHFKLDLPPIESGVYFVQISEIGKKSILKKLMIFKE